MKFDTANILKTNELQTTFMWEVVLPPIPANPGSELIDSDFVSSLIQEVSFSEYSMEDLTNQRMGPAQLFTSGKTSIKPVTMKILSDSEGMVIKYFRAWQERIFDTNLQVNYLKDHYVFPIHCILYNRAQDSKMSFALVNAFPKTFPVHNLQSANSSFVIFDIQFSVDDIIILT